MRFKHVIWDYDGTLFDTYPLMAAAFGNALLERGIVEPTETIAALMRVTVGTAIKHYTDKYRIDDVFLERFSELRKAIENENTKPFDGVIELCRAVFENGGKNYLFTHRGNSAAYFMEKHGLATFFAELITSKSKQGFSRKPSPDALLYLMNKHGFTRDEAIMAGDRDLDIWAAKNAGIHSCYFSPQNERLDIAGFNINHFSELYGILEIAPPLGGATGAG